MYTTIIHPLRKALHLSCNEYCVLDSIYRLSNNIELQGWCIISRQKLGDFLDLSKQSIITIIDNLEKRGYIEKNIIGHTKPVNGIISLLSPDSEINLYSLKEDEALLMVDKYFTTGKETLPVKKLYQNGRETLPNGDKETLPYIDISNKENKEIYNRDYSKDSEVNNAFIEYLQMRKKKKLDNTERIINRLLKKLHEYASNKTEALEIIEKAITSCWKDFYPIKDKKEIISASKSYQNLENYKSGYDR